MAHIVPLDTFLVFGKERTTGKLSPDTIGFDKTGVRDCASVRDGEWPGEHWSADGPPKASSG
jgi:hypothetical protein